MLTVSAYAKVNLTLEVLGKRSDGYHEIRTVLQTIDLHDTLVCQPAQDIELLSPPLTARAEDNLVLRAALMLQQATGCKKGAVLSLTKGIPAAAGMGGGSSDAAAALCVLNRLWGTGLGREALARVAAGLGSDVAFFLYGGTALAEGRGEIITPLPATPDLWLVIVRPPLEVPEKTASLYSRLDSRHFSDGRATAALVSQLNRRQRLEPDLLYNVFEAVAPEVFPGLHGYCQSLIAAEAPVVHLAGSGPSLFTVVGDRSQAEAISGRLSARDVASYVARTVDAETAAPQLA
ncbi:MAG: 4-(cytidine 5'-diphospho)-2-C-methyl-D-erythritol kinase [Chloroflexi bacterium]|nr:4-(cytidine 5'-diphospho)-2-C-methyl-D-erythritol kinase [Chloroflexota bacterium]